ncbi:MAG: hypothetical protein ACLFVC_08805, partial [Opitutales bacterium]
ELDQPVGQATASIDLTTLDLQFAIHRSSGRWALGVDDFAFPNLDLVESVESGQPEDALYILGFNQRSIFINDIHVAEISDSALKDHLDDRRLWKLIPEDTEYFIQEGVIKVEQYTEEKPHQRLRILYYRGYQNTILDQDQQPMKTIDGGELGPIVIYGSAGPTPSFFKLVADVEYTDPRDLKHIKWELFASDDLENDYTLLREGRFNQGSPEIIIPLREGENAPPLNLSIRVFLDI